MAVMLAFFGCKTLQNTQRCLQLSSNRYFSRVVALSGVAVQEENKINTLKNFFSDLWDGFLLAVPKQKRSLAKRRHLRKFKALKPRDDIEDCVVCGGKKLRGKLCHNCFQWTMSLTEKVWQKQKDDGILRNDRFVK